MHCAIVAEKALASPGRPHKGQPAERAEGRRARTRCCAWSGRCRCPRRRCCGSWPWMTGRCARGARTARSWWTSNAAAWWTCCPTGRPRRWRGGCGPGRGSRSSPATARRNTPAASRWARPRRFKSPTAGTCWPTCARRSSAGCTPPTPGSGACRCRRPAQGRLRSRPAATKHSGATAPSGRHGLRAGRGGRPTARRSGGGTSQASR